MNILGKASQYNGRDKKHQIFPDMSGYLAPPLLVFSGYLRKKKMFLPGFPQYCTKTMVHLHLRFSVDKNNKI